MQNEKKPIVIADTPIIEEGIAQKILDSDIKIVNVPSPIQENVNPVPANTVNGPSKNPVAEMLARMKGQRHMHGRYTPKTTGAFGGKKKSNHVRGWKRK